MRRRAEKAGAASTPRQDTKHLVIADGHRQGEAVGSSLTQYMNLCLSSLESWEVPIHREADMSLTEVEDGVTTAPTGTDAPLIVYSSDTHIGPRVQEDLRPYCPEKYLSEFDEFGKTDFANPDVHRAGHAAFQSDEYMQGLDRNDLTEGHHDPHARLRDFDRDGVVGGVIYHGSNFQPFPFHTPIEVLGGIPTTSEQWELAGVGRTLYNRWLADFCSVEPERHVGLAQLPFWDLEAAVKELEWCAENGLRGVNFPATGNGAYMVQPYDPAFDRFFAAAASLDMTLSTHLGAVGEFVASLDEAVYAFMLMDMSQWGTRSLAIMAMFGVFERHPNLKLVLTEVPGVFWQDLCHRMDSVYRSPHRRRERLLPRLPSEYLTTNVWIGASFMARHEAVSAIEIGREDRFCWGSDYPHPEGTFTYPKDPDEYPMNLVALRNTFHDLPADKVRKIVGTNLLDAYPRVDRAAVTKVAERIGPSSKEIATAAKLSEYPFVYETGTCAFRTSGAWD
jgi:predicted TIM-barrel fold metal-dependent hydrolase